MAVLFFKKVVLLWFYVEDIYSALCRCFHIMTRCGFSVLTWNCHFEEIDFTSIVAGDGINGGVLGNFKEDPIFLLLWKWLGPGSIFHRVRPTSRTDADCGALFLWILLVFWFYVILCKIPDSCIQFSFALVAFCVGNSWEGRSQCAWGLSARVSFFCVVLTACFLLRFFLSEKFDLSHFNDYSW